MQDQWLNIFLLNKSEFSYYPIIYYFSGFLFPILVINNSLSNFYDYKFNSNKYQSKKFKFISYLFTFIVLILSILTIKYFIFSIRYIIPQVDLIINSTPIGMKNFNIDFDELPFGKDFWSSLNPKSIVYDLVYNPRFTKLLRFSENKGCHIIDGSEMLVAQGAKSLSYWTGIKDIPTEIMKQAINKYL